MKDEDIEKYIEDRMNSLLIRREFLLKSIDKVHHSPDNLKYFPLISESTHRLDELYQLKLWINAFKESEKIIQE